MGEIHEERAELAKRAMRLGLSRFRDEEVYEALLTFCPGGRDPEETRRLAWRLHVHLSGFEKLTGASMAELKSVKGMDDASALFLSLTARICRRGSEERERARRLTDPKAAGRFLAAKLRGLSREVTVAACLDRELRVVRCDAAASGDVFATEADAYDIAGRIIQADAAAVILAHNHLTGDPQPSREDLLVTESMARSFQRANLILLDHIIVAGDSFVSLAANGFFNDGNEPLRARYCPRGERG